MNITAVTTTLTKTTDTTAYASGDLVANSTTSSQVNACTFSAVANGPARGFRIKRCRIKKSGVIVTNAAFRVHLFSTTPTFTSGGDQSALSTVVVGSAGWIGSFDITAMIAFSDGSVGQGVPVSGSEVNFVPGNTLDLYGILEARGAYATVASEVFTITLEIEWLF